MLGRSPLPLCAFLLRIAFSYSDTIMMIKEDLLWYVVYCHSFKERQVARILQSELHLAVYLPEIDQGYLPQDIKPLFPKYLFAQINLEQISLYSIKIIPGIIGLVSSANIPQAISSETITNLRKVVQHLNAANESTNTFQPGERVRINEGIFEGLEATFIKKLQAAERVYVLMAFLGALREVELDIEAIEPLDRIINRPRRTRGRGRHIKQKSM